MNLIGQAYLRGKNIIFPPRLQNPSAQQVLTHRFLLEWQNHQELDPAALLRHNLEFTALHVPYYRSYFGKNPELDPSNLSHWPILTRDLLRNQFEALQSDQKPRGKTWTHASGGSTGKPVAVVHDEYFAAKAQALRELCAQLFYEGPHYNKLILWGMNAEVERQKQTPNNWRGRTKDWLLRYAGLKTHHINTFKFTQEKFDECLWVLKRQKPRFLFGYAGSVYQLAKYIERNKVQLASRPICIGTTAQTLYPFMRETIERVFGCRVCDHYGSREVGPIAWQGKDALMYFPNFFSHIEVVDSAGKPCSQGETGRLLVTTLHNFSMPLVRYEIGDLGVQGADKTYAGYPCQTLERIEGKVNEEFVTRNDTLIHGQFFINLFYYRPWVDEFQVVQKDYEHVDILYIAKPADAVAMDADKREITGAIQAAMSPNTQVLWHEVADIPVTQAGKRLYVKSEVPRPA